MGKPTGFLEYPKRVRDYAPVEERTKHYNEFTHDLPEDELSLQGARFTRMNTAKPFKSCIRQTISQNLRAVFAQHLAKKPVR
jgi:hypothetical protein